MHAITFSPTAGIREALLRLGKRRQTAAESVIEDGPWAYAPPTVGVGPGLWAMPGEVAEPGFGFSVSVLMGVWLAIYFGVHAARNYRQAGIDRWKHRAQCFLNQSLWNRELFESGEKSIQWRGVLFYRRF